MKINWLVILILVFGAFLRIWNLGNFPVNLTPDEAALGYNAYSILETGRDEYGKFLPIVFKSFGDYKPGLYVYLMLPFVWLLGLNEWSVRLPGALAGVVAVWLIAKLKIKYQKLKIGKMQVPVSYLAALVLAISPWHIQFSRGAWEANVALTMVLGGVYLIIYSLQLTIDNNEVALSSSPLKRGRIMLWLSAILFGLSLWTYQGAKFSTILVILALGMVYGMQVWKNFDRKILGIWILILGLLALPIAWGLVGGETGGRLAVKSIFSYERSVEIVENEVLRPSGIELDSWQYLWWHGEWLNTGRMILSRYFNHFSGRFLGFEGDWAHLWLSSPYMGMIFWFDLVLLIFGISQLFVIDQGGPSQPPLRKGRGSLGVFMLVWLVLAPVPSALTLDEVNAVRSLQMVVPLAFFVGVGWWVIINKISNIKYQISNEFFSKWLIVMLVVGILVFQLVYYLDSYYVLTPKLTASEGQGYGYKEMVEAAQPYRGTDNKIVVYQSYDQPYIYWLFYEKFDPGKYQQIAKLEENRYGDVGLVEKIDDQVEYREFSLNAEKHLAGNIYVGPPEKVPDNLINQSKNFNLIDEIFYPNGKVAFRVVKVIGN